MESDFIRKKGFTLAEVLITLGIIGVVAALTLPAFTAKYQKHVIETRLEKFYSTILQAQKLSELDNGDISTWESPDASNTIDWFNKYYKKYFRTLQVEEPDAGSNPDLGVVRKAAQMKFQDGSLFFMHKDAMYFYPQADKAKICMDEKSNADVKNCSGKYYFLFYYYPKKGIHPYGYYDTDEVIKDNPYMGCIENPAHERAFCTVVIMKNGWKIPDNYPIKF